MPKQIKPVKTLDDLFWLFNIDESKIKHISEQESPVNALPPKVCIVGYYHKKNIRIVDRGDFFIIVINRKWLRIDKATGSYGRYIIVCT